MGAQIALKSQIGNVAVTPELHAYISHSFKEKSPVTEARLDGRANPLPTGISPGSGTWYNLGGQINAELYNGRAELGINYELDLAPKYMAHTGSLKLRIMF